MASERAPDPTRRLTLALLASALIHAAIASPWGWWRLPDRTPIVVRPHLQARVTTPTPKPPPRPEAAPKSPPAKPQPPRQRKPVSGSRAEWAVAPSGQEAKPVEPAAPEPPPQPPVEEPLVDAIVSDRPTPPEYPPEARRQGLEGCVLAAVSVDADGSVGEVEIVAADLPGVFDQAVIDSQKNARYLPARRGGTTLPSRVLAVAGFVMTPDRHLNCALKYAGTAQRLIGAAAPAGGQR